MFLSSYRHFDIGSCPCYLYRRLARGSKVSPDPAKADERISLNPVICEIPNHIETFKYRMLTMILNGMNSFIVHRIPLSTVGPSLFVHTQRCIMYPGGKNTKTFFFYSLFCLFFVWGEENVMSDMLKSTEQKADVGLSLLIPHTTTMDFCFHPVTTSRASSGCCAGTGAISPLSIGAGRENV